MSKGVDTSGHSGRMVPKDRWKPTTAITGPMGAVTAHVPTPNDSGITMAAWAGPQGHHAEVEHDVAAGYGNMRGMEHARYVAGPFRTQARAQVAAESLASRVENDGNTKPYQQERWSEYRGRSY